MFSRFILAITFAALFALPVQAKTKDINIGLITWAGHGVIFVGIEKGFFGDLNVKAVTMDDAPARNAAWLSGKLDFVVQTIDATPIEYAQGMTGKLIFVQDESAGGDGIISKKDIKTVKDLKGKTISFARGNPSHFLLYKLLQDNGMSLADIKPVITDDAGTATQTFLSGKTDAAVTYEPYISQAVKSKPQDIHILTTSKKYHDAIVDTIRVSDELLAKDPEAVKTFIKGWQQSIAYAKAYPQEAATIIGKGFGVPVEDMVQNLNGLQFFDPETNNRYFCVADAQLPKIYDEAAALWMKEKIIDKAPPKGKDVISTIGCDLYTAK